MEFRACKTKDIPALGALWQTVFGDTDDFIRAFFAQIFVPEKSVLAEENGRVVAMAHAITIGEITLSGRTMSVTELYGVATEEAYRGRGLASELIRRILACTADSYQTVKPADEDLFDFYAQFGYQAVFSEFAAAEIFGEEKIFSAAEYRAEREKLLQGVTHIRHSTESLAFWQSIGGRFAAFSDRIAAYECHMGQKVFKEILPPVEKKTAAFAMAIPQTDENGLYFGFAFD